MELNEVIGRIFGRHLGLIAALTLAGFLGAFALHMNDTPRYSATTRLVLDAPDPTNQSQSAVIADTARAIASSFSLVEDALAKVGVRRDARDLALHGIEVQALGSSGVVQLSVIDSDPGIAVALANTIGKSVIETRLDVTAGQAARTVRDLDRQISQMQAQADSLDRMIDRLNPQDASSRGQLNQLLSQRTTLTQRLGQLQNERATVEGSQALRPKAAIIDRASAPAQKLPGRRLPDIVLGGLLGLLVGVALAAGLESVRPTLVGRTAIARTTGAPVLAELVGPPGRRGHRYGWHPADVAEAAMHVELVAMAAGIQKIQLMALDRQIDLSNLARVLADSLSTVSVEQVNTPTARRRRQGFRQAQEIELAIHVDGTGDATPNGSARVGLVIVAPTVVKLTDLDPVKDFLAISAWPLLGVILYQPLRRKAPVHRIDRTRSPYDQFTEADV